MDCFYIGILQYEMHKKMSLKKFSSRKDLQAHSCFLAGAGRVEPPITESKSVALPLGDAPMKSDSIGFQAKKNGASGGTRTHA